MRLVWPVLAFLLLSGCAGTTDEAPAASTGHPVFDDLGDWWPTPEIALTDDRDARRAEVDPPGAPKYAAIDAIMQEFLQSHEIGAGSLAIIHHGKLRYQSGYGHLDEAKTQPTPADAMFRLASVTKPMTAAVLRMMVEEGLLSWEDPVFCVQPEPKPDCRLDIQPHPSRPDPDPRIADMTLADLRDHRTGWHRPECSPDYDGKPVEIAKQFGIPSPPPVWRMMQWVMSEPMHFAPGTEPPDANAAYCNAGYKMLGLAAEAVTGVKLAALQEAYLFQPLQVDGDIEPGRSLPEWRNPREPYYACDYGLTQSVFFPNETVCHPDGGFNMESFIASGGLIATAEAVATVYGAYDNDGEEWRDEARIWSWESHGGGLPGTSTYAVRHVHSTAGHIEIVQLFNGNLPPEHIETATDPVFHSTSAFQVLNSRLLGTYTAIEGLPR